MMAHAFHLYTPEEQARIRAEFWRRVKRSKQGECWPWRATRSGKGYGRMSLTLTARGIPQMFLAHRLALELTGVRIPKGHYACHHCDNPPCCNPACLFPGSPADNSEDADRKGRRSSVLTMKQIEDMRNAYVRGGVTAAALARQFGCSRATAAHVIAGARHRYAAGPVTKLEPPRGELNHLHKLTEKEVVSMRRLRADGATLSELARWYGVDSSAVSLITRGLRWAHVSGPITPRMENTHA